MSDVSPPLHVPGLRHQHITDRAFADYLDRVGHERIRAALRPVLYHNVVAPSSIDQQPPFAKVVATRFLHVDVLARLARHNGSRCMPMIWRRDDNGMNGLVVQHNAKITSDIR